VTSSTSTDPAGGEGLEKPKKPQPGVHSHRVIFIDLARALAVVFMLYGHTVSALLAPQYRVGAWFDVWQFQRGLTSSLFLLLSGFAFSIATSRRWHSHLFLSVAFANRTRRFATFVLLGYALHFPVTQFAYLATASDERWRSFLAVDVLQLIGVTFITVQLLVLAARSRRVFTGVAFTLALLAVVATPWVWRVEWSRTLPLWLVNYLTPSEGSQFPLFPWVGFVMLGSGLGQLYARWGAAHLSAYATQALLLPGLALVALALAGRSFSVSLFGPGPPGAVPMDVLTRAGACLVVLAAIAQASRRITQLPRIFGAVAQETLLIYFVHLCIVYGSIWNPGLSQVYGPTLTPAATVGCVLMLLVSMVGLAWYWNWWKHTSPAGARWMAYAAGGLLLFKLL